MPHVSFKFANLTDSYHMCSQASWSFHHWTPNYSTIWLNTLPPHIPFEICTSCHLFFPVAYSWSTVFVPIPDVHSVFYLILIIRPMCKYKLVLGQSSCNCWVFFLSQPSCVQAGEFYTLNMFVSHGVVYNCIWVTDKWFVRLSCSPVK